MKSQKKIRLNILEGFRDSQITDRYYFPDSQRTLLWAHSEESFIALNPDRTYDLYSPGRLELFTDSLTKEDLKDWAEHYMED